MNRGTAIVVGAGIVGLATARALSIKGYSVRIFERTQKAIGASVRNFGMIWPIGQTSGNLYERAMRSRTVWAEMAVTGGFWHDPAGSLHLAYHHDEWNVLQELYESFKSYRNVTLLSSDKVMERNKAVVADHLLGGLYSADELIVDPREAIAALALYLNEQYHVQFSWGKCITNITAQAVITGNKERHSADIIFVCSGSDLETLYPELSTGLMITKCKLQMMRFGVQPAHWRMGPAVCGGLSLIHYKSFASAPSLPELRKRYEKELPDYLRWGIHVMVAQNGKGELTIGDSHEDALTHEPFDKAIINKMILDYLGTFARFVNPEIMESWHGTYTKCTDGKAELFFSPEPGVFILNGLGGAGMTLSFGLAEEIMQAF